MLGGAAHLLNFMGSDTIVGIRCANKYYGSKMAGFSIPAAEHSSITGWGKENEAEAYRNMLKQFAKPGALVAVVSDSYDLWNAITNLWGTQLKDEVVKSGAVVIIRPDSGNPPEVVV
jgi:nicotinamide phosphoribosyltransferase